MNVINGTQDNGLTKSSPDLISILIIVQLINREMCIFVRQNKVEITSSPIFVSLFVQILISLAVWELIGYVFQFVCLLMYNLILQIAT